MIFCKTVLFQLEISTKGNFGITMGMNCGPEDSNIWHEIPAVLYIVVTGLQFGQNNFSKQLRNLYLKELTMTPKDKPFITSQIHSVFSILFYSIPFITFIALNLC